MTNLISSIISDKNLKEAFDWLCKSRQHFSHNSDVWHLRYNWDKVKKQIITSLKNGSYRFGPLQQYRFENEYKNIWSAQDALVLKAIAQVLTPLIAPQLSTRCTSIKGNGGLKYAVGQVQENLENYKFVARSDIFKYYASIDHEILYNQCEHVFDPTALYHLIL